MKKWTLLIVLALIAVLGGGYYLFSHGKGKTPERGETDMDSEDFDEGEAGDDLDKGDNTYDMLEDPDAGQGPGHDGASAPAGKGQTAPGSVETIDDDDHGETVKDPALYDDGTDSMDNVEGGKGAEAPKP